MGRLNNKIALITGGTTGIGQATAQRFAAEGATVIVTGSSAASVEAARAVLAPKIEIVRSDAGKLSDIQALIAGVKARHGRLDILFANAGTGSMRTIAQVDEAYFDAMTGLNFRGVFFTVQQALEIMPDGGCILLTSSVAGRIGAAGGSVYGATKAAVRSLGRSLAAELAPRNIRVNTLTPGPIETPLMAKSGVPMAQLKEMMRTHVPLGRIGHVDEVSGVALFLASADASFMTGAEIVVSGGQTDI